MRRRLLLLIAIGAASVIIGSDFTHAADGMAPPDCDGCIGFAGHAINQGGKVKLKSNWMLATTIEQAREAYGKCGEAIESIDINGDVTV